MSYLNVQIEEFTFKTRKNMQNIFKNLVEKYAINNPYDSHHYIKFNQKKKYTDADIHPSDNPIICHYIQLKIPMPHTQDIKSYIAAMDLLHSDIFVLNRFFNKIYNEKGTSILNTL